MKFHTKVVKVVVSAEGNLIKLGVDSFAARGGAGSSE
jgi:hypothetical protein